MKTFQKKIQKSFKTNCDFLTCFFFLSFLHNIELHFDAIKYIFGIKISCFPQNISWKKLKIKKNLKTVKLIFSFQKTKKKFHVYD
jgi:hypothetical protein